MEQSTEAIEADLISGDQSRVQRSLRFLLDRMNSGQRTTIAPLGMYIFDRFGDRVPDEIQLDFLSLIKQYKWFSPPLSPEERVSTMVALVLRYGDSFVAYYASLKVAIGVVDPVRSVEVAMEEIRKQGLLSPQGVEGAKHFVSRLLERKEPIRLATIQKLREWPREAPYQEVIESIKPELEPDELQILNIA